MIWLRNTKITSLLSILLGILVLMLSIPSAFSQAYGGSSYSECSYGDSCQNQATQVPTTTDNTTTDQGLTILNVFEEYFTNGVGKSLVLDQAEVVYFELVEGSTKVRHSVTVKEVGVDYVTLTLASTPRDVTLRVGEVNKYDVNDDGQADIQITLTSLVDGKANLNFFALTNKQPSIVAPDVAAAKTTYWELLMYIALIVSGLGMFWYLRKRRHNN